MGKASLIVVIGAFFIFFLVSQNINTQLGSATDYSVEFFSELCFVGVHLSLVYPLRALRK